MKNEIQLLHGDCLERIKELPDNSVDSVVTDPPYGLSFMGKKWDYDVPSEEVWRECLRVLKPGGHLLAFAGTRTQHRMAVRIEDAGFEIRDMIAWVYGSGFPKSMDVSKAIDSRRATNDLIRPWLKTLGTREEIAKAAGVTPRQVDHWLGENTPCPQTLTADRFASLCSHFGCVPDWAEAMSPMLGEKIGAITHARSGGNDFGKRPNEKSASRTVDVHETATEAARRWKGWGTALKPAIEPITVARKPLTGTVAANVLTHGTGALNIDASRIPTDPSVDDPRLGGAGTWSSDKMAKNVYEGGYAGERVGSSPLGRWPANLIHDGSEEVVGLFPIANDNSAARFFYCAKASKRDRDEGIDHLPAKEWRNEGAPIPQRASRPFIPSRNNHPTVKPTDLMRYLCRLVTPPGGTVLDPFMGSGSTGKAAMLEGFQFIGIEREADYMEIAKARIEAAKTLT